MDNKHISNTTEKNVVSHATINNETAENHFNALMYIIKKENDSHFYDISSDSEDAASIVNPSSSPSTALPIFHSEDATSIVNPSSSPPTALPILHSEDATCIVNPSSSPSSTALPIISYEDNSTDDNTTKSYRNKNIARASSLQLKRSLKKKPYFRNKEKSSRKNCIKNVLLDKNISDSAGLSDSGSLSDSIILSDSGRLSDSEIIVRNTNNLLDYEIFSETDSEEIFPDCEIKETDFLMIGSDDDLNLDSNCEFKINPDSEEGIDYLIIKSDDDLSLDSNCEYKINPDRQTEVSCKFVSDSEKSLDGKIILNSVKDSNCEMVPDAETKSDSNEQSHINTSIIEDEFNNNKLSTLKIISNVQNRSDHEILLDSNDKILETASWSEKGMINYKIITVDEIKPSGYKGLTCIIISDNDDEFHTIEFSTYKINVQKGSNSKILLDGEKVKIETESKEKIYEIRPFENKKSSKCIMIFDDKNDLVNKKISTFKIVSNVKKDCEMLLDGDILYVIESQNGKIKYIILSKDEIEFSDNPRSSIMLSNNENEFNNKKSTFKIVVKNYQKGSQSENKEIQNFKKVSDIEIMPTGKIIQKTLNDNNTINNIKQDTTQEDLKEYLMAIKYFFENTQNYSLKKLYSQIGNEKNMLLYLMENFRMFYNEELVVSETADEFSKDYLKEQKNALFNCFGDPKDSINASKPFIHPSSHLHQYSKRLSSNIEPLVIKNITNTTSTSTRSNTKLLPLCNSVKSRPIPFYLSDDNQTFPYLPLSKTLTFHLPSTIKKKTHNNSKVISLQTCKLKK